MGTDTAFMCVLDGTHLYAIKRNMSQDEGNLINYFSDIQCLRNIVLMCFRLHFQNFTGVFDLCRKKYPAAYTFDRYAAAQAVRS